MKMLDPQDLFPSEARTKNCFTLGLAQIPV